MKAQHAGNTIANALKAPWVAAVVAALLLSACGGGGSSDSSDSDGSGSGSGGGEGGSGGSGGGSAAPLTAAVPSLAFVSVKTFRFSWTDVSDATYYKLLENPDGHSGFTQVGSDIAQGTQNIDHVVPLYARVNAQYLLQSCNAVGCTDSATVSVSGTLDSIGYVKAGNAAAGDSFGSAVSLSADGDTLAVGAAGEDSNATGVNGDQSNNSASGAGAVYVFTRTDDSWTQQAYVKASNADGSDIFGSAVSLSADGDTLAVGAPGENSNATGVNGDQSNDDAYAAGAVYVFTRTDDSWTQRAYVKASNADGSDNFGDAVSLSGDGDTLAVGAPGENSNATGVNGDQSNDDAYAAGAVYVFTRTDGSWTQQAYVKAGNAGDYDYFGAAVSLSAEGDTLAVGMPWEDSDATGVNGDQSNDDASYAGAVYVFTRTYGIWTQQAYVKASNAGAYDSFGTAVSLSADGDTLAVGAPYEASNATGMNGDQSNDDAINAGAVYVFTRTDDSWTQQAYVKASNAEEGDYFGRAVSLSEDGDTLAVGAPYEASNATGVNGEQSDDDAGFAGAVYVFTRTDASWTQQAYVKASNAGADDYFGWAVSLSADGDTLAVGADGEDSHATGVNGDQSDNSAGDAGAVYLY